VPKASSLFQFDTPAPVGPAMQYWVPASIHGLAATIPAGGQIATNVIVSEGYTLIGAGVISSQAGTIKIQPFLDEAGTMALAPSSSAVTAASLAVVNNAGSAVPFQSLQIIVTNSGASSAAISSFGLLLQAR
jgi:hypothetical protein